MKVWWLGDNVSLYLSESHPNFFMGCTYTHNLYDKKKNKVCTFMYPEIMDQKLILVDLVDTLGQPWKDEFK